MLKKLEKLSAFASNYFVVWVLLISAYSLVRPGAFLFVLRHVKILLGVIMFGMGMTLSTRDFLRVLSRPRDVIVGVCAQYIVMPLLALGLARAFRLPPEIAVGVILVGTCPGGTASNVITFLARGDVALSVSMTSISTVLSPFLTPVLTLWLAGQWMEIQATVLFLSIVQIVVVPVLAGVLVHRFFARTVAKSTKVLPLISVVTIVLIVGAVVGKNADNIRTIGLAVAAVVVLHNLLGLLLGYTVGHLLKVGGPRKRAITIEVGMQNSGLAVALAMAHFTPLAALPGALFSVWHNISGPLLATIWSRHDREERKTEGRAKPRVVIDINALVAARWKKKGASNSLMKMCIDGQVQALITPAIEKENRFIIGKVRAPADYMEEMEAFFASAETVTNTPELTVSEDPADNKFVECALAGAADCIISSDRHLLDLNGYEGIRICNAGAFLNLHSAVHSATEHTAQRSRNQSEENRE